MFSIALNMARPMPTYPRPTSASLPARSAATRLGEGRRGSFSFRSKYRFDRLFRPNVFVSPPQPLQTSASVDQNSRFRSTAAVPIDFDSRPVGRVALQRCRASNPFDVVSTYKVGSWYPILRVTSPVRLGEHRSLSCFQVLFPGLVSRSCFQVLFPGLVSSFPRNPTRAPPQSRASQSQLITGSSIPQSRADVVPRREVTVELE
jgi:hypothetical protein